MLSRFLLSSDSNQSDSEIDLRLALRALPKRFTEHNAHKIELINFSVIQMSLIAFQNDDKDELFNFNDRRNTKRLFKLFAASKDNTEGITTLKSRSFALITKLGRVFGVKTENLFDEDAKDPEDKIEEYNEKSESASDLTSK